METMSREELIALFGVEAGEEMYAQQNALNTSGGVREPFPLLKKVVDGDLGIGKFGTFVFGLEYDKDRDANGDKVITNVGTNIGDTFDFIIVHNSYRFKRWVEGAGKDKKGKTEWSNIFTDMSGFKTAVDYNGNPIPDNKEARAALGWKTVRIMGGLVKTDKGWEPVIFEIDGKMYFTFNDVIDKAPNKGLLGCVVHLVTKTEKQGSTKYTVVDTEKSSFTAEGIFDIIKVNKDVIADVTLKMKAYQSDNDYKAKSGGTSGATGTANTAVDSDDTNW